MSLSSYFVVLLVFCFLFIFICPSTTETLAQVLDKTYSNKQCGISFQYPSNWKIEEITWDEEKVWNESQPKVINFLVDLEPDVPKGYNNVVSVELDDISRLSDTTFEGIRNYEHDTLVVYGVQGLSSTTTKISGFPAQKMVYNEELPQMKEAEKFKTMKAIIVAYNKEYVILYDSTNAYYDKYISTFEKMLRSFKISAPNFEGIECQEVPQNIPIADGNSPRIVNTSNTVLAQTNEKENISNDSSLKTILEKAQESMRNR
jgi:hypothetical protein